LAALGDALFWGALRPFLVVWSIAVFVVLRGLGVEPAWPWALGIFLIPYNLAAMGMRWVALGEGYEHGEKLPAALAAMPFKTLSRWLRLAGTLVALALLLASFFDPAGLEPLPSVALAALCAGFMRLHIASREFYLAALAFGVVAAAAGLRLY
jgi:PTS system mannose/fructose/sorbose family IID component